MARSPRTASGRPRRSNRYTNRDTAIRKKGSALNEYYTMLVCENGHVITDKYESSPRKDAYCDQCGAPTMTACPNCKEHIRGEIINSGIVYLGKRHAPKYCPACGKPYPWTQGAIDALKELACMDDGLTEEDAETLADSAPAIITETPKTKVAAIKFKKILAKAGKETASAARDLFVDIAAETAKRTIWPS